MNTGREDPYDDEHLWAYELPDDYEPRKETPVSIDPCSKPYSGPVGNTDSTRRGLGISNEYERK